MNKTTGYILFFLGLISYLFFSKYNGNSIPFPTLWYYLSFIPMIAGVVIFTSSSVKGKKMSRSHKLFIEDFKKSAIKIEVDLDECELIANNYVQEIESTGNYRIQGLDAMYESGRNVYEEQVNQAVLLYEKEMNGKKMEFYSQRILKDEVTIRFHLVQQKSTAIYFDPKTENYYFDIEFLLEEPE